MAGALAAGRFFSDFLLRLASFFLALAEDLLLTIFLFLLSTALSTAVSFSSLLSLLLLLLLLLQSSALWSESEALEKIRVACCF